MERKLLTVWALLVFLTASLSDSAGAKGRGGDTRHIPKVATTSPQTGRYTPSGSDDVTQAEFPGQVDEADGSPGPYLGTIVHRRLSRGAGHGVAVTSGQKGRANLHFDLGFEGLNLYQQRYARGGNQFTTEPPDQALCVGNGYVVEAVNAVLNIFDTSGNSRLPDNTATNIVSGFPRNVNNAVDLNSFFGYAPALDRSTGVRAQDLTDPSCLYDAATQRFFIVVWRLERFPNGEYTSENHLDIAVSNTPDPTGTWTIYSVDVTNDGTHNPDPDNACPCLGDYPHIGADAHGFYVTTNAYPWNGNGFNGAQIYAFSKAQLVAGAPQVTMVHLDTFGAVNEPSDAGPTQPGFTVWPAQSPGNQAPSNLEYFLSSNAAVEATHPVAGTGGDYTSNQIILWTLANTSSLDEQSPALALTNQVLEVNQYAIPPGQRPPGAGTAPGTDVPQGHCLNDTRMRTTASGRGCWRLLLNPPGPTYNEVISQPDSSDTRMQQVMYANGKLWGALGTAINPDGGSQRAGIAWFIVNPVAGKLLLQGYLGAAGYDFTYPAIGVTANGRGVMAFTATGDTLYPSAAYASIDAVRGVGPWNIVPGGQGAAITDGFTSYKSLVGSPLLTRWGDYGAAAVDGDSVWIASEYIAQECNYTDWGGPFFLGGTGDNLLGSCGGANHGPGSRVTFGNWSTYISKFTP